MIQEKKAKIKRRKKGVREKRRSVGFGCRQCFKTENNVAQEEKRKRNKNKKIYIF